MTPCPGRDQLERLLTGSVGDGAGEGLEQHVQSCPACQQALESMVGAADWGAGLEGWPALAPSPRPDTFLRRLQQAILPGLAASPSGPGATPVDDAAGRAAPAVPGYEILGELGRGGMGVVYHARQLRLHRPCALKMILAGAHANPEVAARFLTEAQAIARLQHPHVVQIHHIGEAEGLPFLELEYVEGGSLDRQLDGIPWTPGRAARLAEQLARGMAEAHRLGIVHRDLKPGNVLLAGDGTPKITDFGLAKALGSESGLTRTESVLGSPSYMAPEQAQGRARQAGPGADIYALGAILYELLTGRPPFRGATALETLEQVKTVDPVPPSRLVPGLPRDLETITLKCLAKEPGQRYPAAAELVEDLRRFLADRPILARRTGPIERALRWSRRNRALARVTFAFLLALLMGFVGVTTQWIRAERNADREATARRAAEDAREQTRHYLYVARMNLAQQASETGQTRRLVEMLSPYQPGTDQAHLRGFEWYYWWRTCHLYQYSLEGRGGTVNSVAFHPGGGTLASGSLDGAVRIWDSASGRLQSALEGNGVEVRSLAFSPDGRLLASGRRDSTIGVWDFAAGTTRWTLATNADMVFGLAFSPDGAILASAHGDGTIQLRDAANGRFRATLADKAGLVRSVAFSPDGKVLASSSDDYAIKLWDPTTGGLTNTLKAHTDRVWAVAFSPAGTTLASGGDDMQVVLWDVATGRPKFKLGGHTNNIYAVRFSPDGTTLASGSDDGTVRLWDPATGQARAVLQGHTNAVDSLAFSPDGTTLASASEDGAIKLWKLPVVPPGRSFSGQEGIAVLSVAISPDDSVLASTNWEGLIELWDLSTDRLRTTLGSKGSHLRCAVFSPGGTILASAHADGTIRLWDLATGQPRTTLKGHASAVLSLAFSADGATLASVSDDKTVKLWDPATGELKATLLAPGSVPATRPLVDLSLVGAAVAFSPDGATLASSNTDRLVTLWDLATGTPKATLEGQLTMPFSLAFAPDGTTLASAGNGQDVELWDPASGTLKNTLKAHLAWVRAVAFCPDGKTLASASDDRTVVLWDVITGEPKTVLGGQKDYVMSLAFSRNGTTLACGVRGDTVTLWRAATEAQVLAHRE